MPEILDQLRLACALVAERAADVRVDVEAIPAYAATLAPDAVAPAPKIDPARSMPVDARERLAAYWITLDAINFGSGWFPTLRKRDGRSGYHTIAAGLRDRFAVRGPWSAGELQAIDARELATVLGQDPDHELMGLFAAALRDLGCRLETEAAGRFTTLIEAADGSAMALAQRLASWACFSDCSRYGELVVPFGKRAQIACADLARAGAARFDDVARLTMFADNLVPHVLRLDGVLGFSPGLVRRIDRGELLVHGSPEEVEIRACALHAVELIAACRPGSCAAEIDQLLWERGGQPSYKAHPRHRCRCTAY